MLQSCCGCFLTYDRIMIRAESVFKDYGGGRGVFGLDMNVERGETYGFLGPNGAGKTTTLRMLLGFIRPDGGRCSVAGMDPFSCRESIMRMLGYLPAEISFLEGMTGTGFLDFMGSARGIRDMGRRKQLTDFFGLDPEIPLRRMSKGMKQKVAIVSAFMHRPDIIVLDEPTSGLDPLMQSRFNELVSEEKGRGATILMSSHSFEEVEKTCDKVGIIKAGRMVAVESMADLKRRRCRRFIVEFVSAEERLRFEESAGYVCTDAESASLAVNVGPDMDSFIKDLSRFAVSDMKPVGVSLEEMFMQYYR